MVDRMSELFGYQNKDSLTPKIKDLNSNKSIVNNKSSFSYPKDISKSEKAKPEGLSERKKYRNYYDVNGTITVAQTTNPNDEDNIGYNRERIFEVLERNAEIIYVANDGVETLWVIVSHQGGQNFSRERPIYPGDVKEFYNVYELRLRSATVSLPYRVAEYAIDIGCCPKVGSVVSAQSPTFFTAASLGNIPGAQTFSILGSSTVIPSSTFILLSNLTSSTRVSNFPVAAQQMQVVSTSANDAAAGTGAQQVEIDYLTDPASPTLFTRFKEIVTLNGITPVNTVSTGISRIEHMRVSRIGGTGVAQGSISLQSVGGATTFELIPAGENINRTCVHFVPNGYMSIVTDILVGTTTAAGVRFSFTDTPQDTVGNIVRNGLEEISLSESGIAKSLNTPFFMSNPNNKRLSFAVTVRGQAANQQGSGSFLAIDIPL